MLARILGMNIASARARRVVSNNAAALEFRGIVFSDAAEPPPGLAGPSGVALSRRSFALDLTWRRRLLLKVLRPGRLGLANGEAQLGLTEATGCVQ